MDGVLAVDRSRVSASSLVSFHPLALLREQILVFYKFGHLCDAVLASPDLWFAALIGVFSDLS